MIERDILLYLQSKTSLTSLCTQIYLIQAPMDKKMPYLLIESVGGKRGRNTVDTMEEEAQLRITVDCGPGQMVAGRNIIENALHLLENYRGLLYSTNDIYVTCGAIRGWAGLGGSYRYQFDMNAKSIEAIQEPNN